MLQLHLRCHRWLILLLIPWGDFNTQASRVDSSEEAKSNGNNNAAGSSPATATTSPTTTSTTTIIHASTATGGGNNKAAKVFEQLWERIAQHIPQQQQQQPQQYPATNPTTKVDPTTVSGPHVATRGGPGVATRRRALFYSGLHHHYRQLLAQNETDVRTVLQEVLRIFHIAMPEIPAHVDRSASLQSALPPFPESKLRANRKLLREMFQHAYDSYMLHGWPAAEVKPLTCQPGTFNLVKVQGLTLLDSLDTLMVLGNYTEFARAVERVRSLGDFLDVDENVSVFETTIRILGGLLSAHQIAVAFFPNANKTFANASKPSTSKTNTTTTNTILVPESDVLTAEGEVRGDYPSMTNQKNDTTSCGASPHATSPTQSSIPSSSTATSSATTNTAGECTSSSTTTPTTEQQPNKDNTTAYWTYDNFLLSLAQNLGERLLPAFQSRTGIPYGTVNLRHGVPPGETTVASTAGGGTLSMEFELLSRLTGDDRFGKAAKLASRALWIRRSRTPHNLNLFGKHIDINKGHWTETVSGIGSNSDSFIEYLVKHYLLFPEDSDFWMMFAVAYGGIYNHSRLGEWYVDTDMNAGVHFGKSRHVLESLMAFYPGMQVLAGELTPAARSLNSFFMVRELLGFLPERFNFGNWHIDGGRGHASLHPLRPELLESCYFLHRAVSRMGVLPDVRSATSGWLWAADFALYKLESVTRAQCGYSTVYNLKPQTTGTVDGTVDVSQISLVDEMPSFFLSETIKYLYLTFDEDNIFHQDDDHEWIFTTEAHPVHYVPKPTDNFQDEVAQLKALLHERLNGGQVLEAPTLDVLKEEKWTDSTSFKSYCYDMETVQHLYGTAPNESQECFFFKERALIDAFVPSVAMDTFNDTHPLNSMAHSSLKDSGSGSSLRRACPNFYASELLWMHALFGGSTDYSDLYVSVTSDNIQHHPNSYVALGAADALGLHGSGIYLGKVEDKDGFCALSGMSEEDPSSKESAQDSTRQPGSHKFDPSQFQVFAFSEGGGFVVEHVPTGDKVVSSFIFDESDTDLSVMVYAGYSLDPHLVHRTIPSHLANFPSVASLWAMSGKGERSTPSSFRRKVVVADFEGNSFSCEIELYRKDDRTLLATFPCAPGLFGRTHMRYLRSTDGIEIEAALLPPIDGNESGCAESSSATGGTDSAEASVDQSGPALNETGNSVFETSVQVVHRGDCTFYIKAMNMKAQQNAQAVIVVNSEDDELFAMSNGDLNEQVNVSDPEMIPLSILVTGLDGEDLLSIVNGETADGEAVIARIALRRQSNDLVSGDDRSWPTVRGAATSLQILAKGGWGVQALRPNTGSTTEWNLQLLQYTEKK